MFSFWGNLSPEIRMCGLSRSLIFLNFSMSQYAHFNSLRFKNVASFSLTWVGEMFNIESICIWGEKTKLECSVTNNCADVASVSVTFWSIRNVSSIRCLHPPLIKGSFFVSPMKGRQKRGVLQNRSLQTNQSSYISFNIYELPSTIYHLLSTIYYLPSPSFDTFLSQYQKGNALPIFPWFY